MVAPVDREDAVTITVDGGRQTVCKNVLIQQRHVAERRFGVDKTQSHQFAGGVVDEHQQATAWRASPEPVVRGTVDLDPFAARGAPRPLRGGGGPPTAPGLPQTGAQHGLTHCLNRQFDLVDFLQLFARQRGPKSASCALTKAIAFSRTSAGVRRSDGLPRLLLNKPSVPSSSIRRFSRLICRTLMPSLPAALA